MDSRTRINNMSITQPYATPRLSLFYYVLILYYITRSYILEVILILFVCSEKSMLL